MEQESWTSKGIAADTRRGLQDSPKWLSSLYFYDAHGSDLFEQICETPEYYPTRTEHGLLRAHSEAILDAVGDCVLAELGSGSSAKTRTILTAFRKRGGTRYQPVDVSAQFLSDVATQLEAEFPGLVVEPIAAEYGEGLARIGATNAPRHLVLFLGSSLGNFEPTEQLGLLKAAHDALQPGDHFLLGTDLVKDPAILEAAYNDAAGVTAAFNLNILTHLNRELAGNANVANFHHVAVWNPKRSRIEMHLESTIDQELHFPGADLQVPVAKGERIHTENSYKFTLPGAQELAAQAGFAVEQTWTDDKQWFGLHLLRRL